MKANEKKVQELVEVLLYLRDHSEGLTMDDVALIEQAVHDAGADVPPVPWDYEPSYRG